MLWVVQQSVEGLQRYFELAEREKNFSLIRNKEEVHLSLVGSDMPDSRPALRVQDPSFRLDFFEDGCTFVSRRLIEAMALPPGAVSYGDVDTSGCDDAVRAREYRVMVVNRSGAAVDPTGTDGDMVDVVQPDGSTFAEWQIATPRPNQPAQRIRWRADYRPPADLFRVNGTPWRAATDALASRVLAAGLVGIAFADVVASALSGDLVLKGV